jgi:hypothetical protein
MADTQIRKAPPPSEGFADEMSDAAGGIGLFTISLFGAVPGFLPTVALTIFAGALVVIPVLIVGGAAALAFGLLLVLARLVSRGVTLAGRGHDESDDAKEPKATLVSTDPQAALH